MTEFKISGEKLYLSPVLDLYNGEIVAYQMEPRPHLSMVDDRLTKALSVLSEGEYPLLHSDRTGSIRWHTIKSDSEKQS